MVRGGAGNADGQPPGHVDDLASSLQEVTGVYPDASLMARALTHRSFAYEHGGLPHNERLEFLGDSVLGLVVTDHLYDAHPDLTEGQLARLRAAVVNMRALADVGRTLGLGDYLFLGRGEESTGGRDKDSILADSVESVIGAVYLSGGVPAATALVHHILDPLMNATASLGAGLDWKTSLQSWPHSTRSEDPSTASRSPVPSTPRPSARASWWPAKNAAPARVAPRRTPSSRRPPRPGTCCGSASGTRAGRRRCPGWTDPRCLSCLRSKSSAWVWPSTSPAGGSPRSICAVTASPGVICPDRPTW